MRRAVLALLLAYACSESGSAPPAPPNVTGGAAGGPSTAGAPSGTVGEPAAGAGGDASSEGGAPSAGQGGVGVGVGGEPHEPWTRETWSPSAAIGGECKADSDCCPVDVEACFVDAESGAIVGGWDEPSAGAGGSDAGAGGQPDAPRPTDPAPLRCLDGLCAFGGWNKPGDCNTFKFGRVCRQLGGYCGLGPESARPDVPLSVCVTP